MTLDRLIRKQTDALNRHDSVTFASCYAPDAVVVDPQYPEPLRGTAAVDKDMADFFVAFPDIKVQVRKAIGSGETYATEVTMTGTHQGPLVGPAGHVPATNRRIEIGGAVFGRLDQDGRIAEERRYWDLAGMMGQLGLMQ